MSLKAFQTPEAAKVQANAEELSDKLVQCLMDACEGTSLTDQEVWLAATILLLRIEQVMGSEQVARLRSLVQFTDQVTDNDLLLPEPDYKC